ncbi:UNVERIFIED_ORG: hypothetical protein E4P37_03395 [Bacillus sp. AZ43]
MATRLWTALLLLSAVFAVHGVQCSAAVGDHAAGHGAPAVTLQAAPPDGGGHTAMTATLGDHTAALTTGLGAAMTAAAPAVAMLTEGHGSGPAGAGGHLWTLCLAVLAAGLAALLALLLPRSLTLLRAARAGLRAHLFPAGLALPRPPDLSALCLLRI